MTMNVKDDVDFRDEHNAIAALQQGNEYRLDALARLHQAQAVRTVYRMSWEKRSWSMRWWRPLTAFSNATCAFPWLPATICSWPAPVNKYKTASKCRLYRRVLSLPKRAHSADVQRAGVITRAFYWSEGEAGAD